MISLYWEWTLRKLGFSGMIGLILLIFSTGLLLAAQPLKTQQTELLKEIARASKQPVKIETLPQDEVRTDVLIRHLPLVNTLPQQLGKIHAVADDLDLALIRGEYRLVEEKSDHLTRYRVVLPVTGDYPQVRLMIAEVLSKIPNAALEKVTFEREDVASEALEARMEWVLYYRDPS